MDAMEKNSRDKHQKVDIRQKLIDIFQNHPTRRWKNIELTRDLGLSEKRRNTVNYHLQEMEASGMLRKHNEHKNTTYTWNLADDTEIVKSILKKIQDEGSVLKSELPDLSPHACEILKVYTYISREGRNEEEIDRVYIRPSHAQEVKVCPICNEPLGETDWLLMEDYDPLWAEDGSFVDDSIIIHPTCLKKWHSADFVEKANFLYQNKDHLKFHYLEHTPLCAECHLPLGFAALSVRLLGQRYWLRTFFSNIFNQWAHREERDAAQDPHSGVIWYLTELSKIEEFLARLNEIHLKTSESPLYSSQIELQDRACYFLEKLIQALAEDDQRIEKAKQDILDTFFGDAGIPYHYFTRANFVDYGTTLRTATSLIIMDGGDQLHPKCFERRNQKTKRGRVIHV